MAIAAVAVTVRRQPSTELARQTPSLRRRCTGLLIAICLAGWVAPTTYAQQTGSASAAGHTSLFVRNWTRAEAWRFFEPHPGGGDPDYGDIANRL